MKRISIITSAVLLACSCMTERIGDPTYVDTAREDTVDVEFRITSRDSSATRSSISASETEIEDINIYAYSGGRLENETYIDSPKSVSLSLARGKTYNLYALSNIGRHEAPVSEDELLDLKLSMGYMSSIDGGFPMSWSKTGHMVSAAASGVDVTLVRLVSRIRLSLDRSELENFRVRAVRLCQSALCVCPFTASRAESRYEVGNGDYASSSDLSTLNSGGEISFYAYENRQGVLLPDNTNADSKIPSSIPANAELCTYLELSGSYSGEYEGVDVYSDNVKYRFYLGEDNCTDFNVTRNKDIRVNLKVTEERIFDESWRISYGNDLPSVSYALECSSTSSSLDVGESRTVSATYVQTVDGVRNTETDVTSYAAWSSSNSRVATVSDGKITAVGAGTATITVTYNGYKSTHTVNVNDVLTYSLSVSLSNSYIKVGEKTTAKATYKTYRNGILSDSRDVTSSATWSSGSSSVATVSGGTVTAKGAGTANIQASYGGETASASVTVTDVITYGLVMNKSTMSIQEGSAGTVSVSYVKYTNGEVTTSSSVTSLATWSSSSESTATVSRGTVSGVKAGTAVITATYAGHEASCTVTVTERPVEYTYALEVKLAKSSINVGESTSATATYVTYANGVESKREDVTSSASWTAGTTTVASVSSGRVTGKTAGTSYIKATYGGKAGTADLTVNDVYTYALSVTLSPSSIKVGGTASATARYITYKNGTQSSSVDVTSEASWSSSSTSVATVYSGSVSGKKAGTASIKATYNGCSDSKTITVSDDVTYGLKVSVASPTIYIGSTTQASARYITYTNGVETSSTDVTSSATWTSSNTSVATVSKGTVTGKAAGTTSIKATYNGTQGSCTVEVIAKPVTYTYALEVKLADSSFNVGETTTATATYITYADGVKSSSKDVTSSASWSSGTTTVATVSGGTVTGKASGTSVIKATYNGYTASATVTVNDVLTYGLELSVTSATISVGNTKTIAANYITFTNGTRTSSKTVTSSASWSSSNSAVASVSGGSVTAKANGSATITATYNGYSATTTVTVEDDITYDYQLSPTSTSVVNGRTTKMTAVRRTFTNGAQTNGEDYSSNFTWTSSSTSVATVGSNGVITGVGAGTATITAKYGGTTLTGTVTVTPNYTYELVLNKTSMNMGKGRTETLVATYKTYADGVLESSKDVTSSATWSSSSSSVAGVSGGTITGNGVGSATITATYSGKSATCAVKVIGSPTLSLGWTSADLEKGDVRTNAAIYNPNNGTASTNVTSSAVWTTSNSGVATVGGGQITAQGKGTCTITATYNGVSASCTVNVTDNDTPSTNTYVSNMSVQAVNISGTKNYKLTLSLKFSDGTVVEDAPYTWSVTYSQNTSIATGTSGDAPIVYTGGGSTYVMAVTITTKAYYYDANGNRRQHTTGTSFSHNTEWKP